MRHWATVPFIVLFGLLVWPAEANGQEQTTSSLTGVVVDEAGEPLPGANVLAVHEPSGTRYGTSTTESGRYNLANLRVGGPYTVTVSFVGYQTKRRENLQFTLGETEQIDFTLAEQTAELDEVEVVAGAQGRLTSEQEGVATNISSEEVESQPTMGRKLADVTRLVPESFVATNDDDGPAISFAGQNTDFNSIYIDGAISNDVYGLSAQGTDGGQTGATPISLSAIESFQVDVSPFSVTQSGFTGAAVNAVTKSGSNEFEGSFEYYRRDENLAEELPPFSNNRYVGTVGGPIVEDKLFFFANVDILREEEPQPNLIDPKDNEYQGTLGVEGNPDNNQLDGLDEVRNFVERNTGYDPGGFGDKNTILESNKFLGRLDYNITQGHQLTARYYYNDNKNIDRFQTTSSFVNYANNSEIFPNTQHNAMLQYTGSFGNRVSTKIIASFKNVVDDRGVQGEPFPSISVDDAGGGFSLGSEPFSLINYLEQSVATLTNRTDIYLGDHTLTVGTENQFYDISNTFALFSPGVYNFNNVSDFAETVCHYAEQNQGQYGIQGPGPICQDQYPDPEPQTDSYLRQYSLVDDPPTEPKANDDTNLGSFFQAAQLGFYVQDKWNVTDRLRTTFGVRVDVPRIFDDPRKADDANSGTLYGTDLGSSEFDGPPVGEFHDLKGARAGEVPSWRVFPSPRFGFNLALNEERTSQLRGGSGVFTSRLPFVWPGSLFLNNGVSSDFAFGLGFAGPLPLRRPENGLTKFESNTGIFGPGAFGGPGADSVDDLVPAGNLELMSEDFSYPRVLRTTLGYDQSLPFGIIATLEGQYTNTLQDVIVRNVNLQPPNETLDGPDQRPIYAYGVDGDELDPDAPLIDDRYGNILLIQNTQKGYSYNLTARLQKEPTRIVEGGTVRSRVSYSYGESRSLNVYGGDTPGSLWDDNAHVEGTNNLTLGRSPFSSGHRIQASVDYRQEITSNVAATVSLYYSGTSGRPFSYTISDAADAMIGDDGGSPLLYVPEDASALEFADITDGNGTVLRSAQQQQQDVERFISNTEYLSENRGDYVDRNGDRTPFEGVIDLKTSFEISGPLLAGRQQSLAINMDIFNFSALLGSLSEKAGLGFGEDWGERYSFVGQYSVLDFQGFEDAGNGNFTPIYQSNLGVSEDSIVRSKEGIFEANTSGTYSSLYQVQLGIEYTF